MTLVELLISVAIFSFVVAGATSAAVLFAKVTADHENRAVFAHDIRISMEALGNDVRNTVRVWPISDTGFTLWLVDGSTVEYSYLNQTVSRTANGRTKALIENVSVFDVLSSAADEPADGSLTYSRDRITIETLTLSANRGSSHNTEATITNYTLNMRNR